MAMSLFDDKSKQPAKQMLAKAFGLAFAGILFLSTGALSCFATDANETVTPPDKNPARHPFLYAGEWDTRKPMEQSIFLVHEGKIVWQYSMPIKTPSGRKPGVRRCHATDQRERHFLKNVRRGNGQPR